MLGLAPVAVAALVPVGPVVVVRRSAFSPVIWNAAVVGVRWSARSVIPVGGVNVVDRALPKNPSTRALGAVVVIDGAVAVALLVLIWPPVTSIGVVVETPE